MGYSGLIYAAIVAGWAAVLVPRWIRRNEEVERAKEADAARGVRVLDRRHGVGHARHPNSRPPATTGARSGATSGAPATASSTPPDGRGSAGVGAARPYSSAARRRRRVLGTLLLLLAGTVALVVTGRLPAAAVVVSTIALSAFLVLARRAAVAEDRLRARARRAARLRAEREAAASPPPGRKRIAVYEEPEPAPPPDPDAWEPVPVPLPTYLTKPKAAAPVVRKIDLSRPGAWTSARLNSASSITLPPRREAEAHDHQRAVGD